MKLIKTILIIIPSIALAWGAPDLLPKEQRSKTYEFVTKLDKKKSFQKITIWSAKTFANSNETIKLKDPELGVLIAKGNISCKALKLGNGYGENQIVEFTLEITANDKKTEVKITDLIGKSTSAYDDGARPSKKEEMDAVTKECLDSYIEEIKKELN